MDTRFAISEYLDAAQVTAQLDALIKKPIYSISPAALKKYEEEYFDKKCAKSKAMITEAKEIIPGGVQHNLAFNYPFPIVMTRPRVLNSMILMATSITTSCRPAVPPSWAPTTMW